MSKQSFERQVADALAKVPGLWVYHAPDEPWAKLWVPADFIYGYARGFGLLECKQTSTHILAAARWTAQQRRQVPKTVQAGGNYYLLVRYPQGDRLFYGEYVSRVRSGLRHDHEDAIKIESLDRLWEWLMAQ